MTVHVISVGVSVLANLETPSARLRGEIPADVADAIAQECPWAIFDGFEASKDTARAKAHEKLTAWFDSAGPATDLAADVAILRPGLWPAGISAEVDTFDRVASTPVGTKDIAILLATDTAKGLLAAAWNALVLAGGKHERVVYRSSPTCPLGDIRGKIVIVRVPGLDARNEREFRSAMGGLGVLGRQLLPKRPDGNKWKDPITAMGEEFRFYLSGGFKAAIPYLIGLAEGLRSVGGTGPVAAFMLHDTAKDEPAIKLPLRRMNLQAICDAVRGYRSDGKRDDRPGSNVLEGYAYEEEPGGGWRLTAFGEGLRRMVDNSPEIVGGS